MRLIQEDANILTNSPALHEYHLLGSLALYREGAGYYTDQLGVIPRLPAMFKNAGFQILATKHNAAVHAKTAASGMNGVWNTDSISSSEKLVNKLINSSTPDQWVEEYSGRYSLSVAVSKLDKYSYIVNSYADRVSTVGGGVQIIMTGRGSGDLVSAYPVYSSAITNP